MRQNNATSQEQDDRSYEDDLPDQDDNPETQRPPSRSSSQPLSSIVETTDSSSHTLAPSLNTGIRQRQQQPINNARKQASPFERSGSQANPITVTAQIEPITICLRKCSSAEFIDVQCQMGLLRTEVQSKDKILRTVRAENEDLATELKNQKWILESAESQVEQIMRKNTEAFSMNRKLNQLVTAQLEEIEHLNYQKQVVENDSSTLREIIYNLQAELRQYDIVPSGYKYPERVQTLISRLSRPLKPVPGYEFDPLVSGPKRNPERDSHHRRTPGPSSLSQEIKLQDDEDESGPQINYERPATPTPPDSNDD
ncbi:hypothetical protein C8Q75DRAFT_607640 [Abortiporus biennis]|nr:hypothetical protein C8Q75DRAFT_607640 [Abortiporus biennis]